MAGNAIGIDRKIDRGVICRGILMAAEAGRVVSIGSDQVFLFGIHMRIVTIETGERGIGGRLGKALAQYETSTRMPRKFTGQIHHVARVELT